MAELNLAKFGKIETLIWLFQKSWPGNTVTPLMYGSNWVPWHEQVWVRHSKARLWLSIHSMAFKYLSRVRSHILGLAYSSFFQELEL